MNKRFWLQAWHDGCPIDEDKYSGRRRVLVTIWEQSNDC
jgi:hypothetical protein